MRTISKACVLFIVFAFFIVFVSTKKISFFAVALYKVVVGFLPVPNCETLAFSKSLSICLKSLISLARNQIKEEEIDLNAHYSSRSLKILDNIYRKNVKKMKALNFYEMLTS